MRKSVINHKMAHQVKKKLNVTVEIRIRAQRHKVGNCNKVSLIILSCQPF